MPTHPVPTAPTGVPDRYHIGGGPSIDSELALQIGLHSLLGWYKREGTIPTEAVQRLVADPVTADHALRRADADPLTVLRRAVQLPALAEPAAEPSRCRCTEDYECDGSGGDPADAEPEPSPLPCVCGKPLDLRRRWGAGPGPFDPAHAGAWEWVHNSGPAPTDHTPQPATTTPDGAA